MRIHDLRQEDGRISALCEWEEAERAPQRIYFSVEQPRYLRVSFDPFLVGSIVPALRNGERRISVEGSVSPLLLAGVNNAMAITSLWYRHEPLVIETRDLEVARRGEVAGLFFSGGIDSAASLKVNRDAYFPQHERYIRDCIRVEWFHGSSGAAEQRRSEAETMLGRAIEKTVAESGAELVLMVTNLRSLADYDRGTFWSRRFVGWALAAVAQALGNRLHTAVVASTLDIPNLRPTGSHPVVDPLLSSEGTMMVHDNAHLSRLHKTRIVSEWEVALDHLVVCTNVPDDRLNCGQCEKCLRTMMALLVLNKLEQSAAFTEDDISARDLTDQVSIRTPWVASCWRDIKEHSHRTDLNNVIRRKLLAFRARTTAKRILRR